MDKIFFKDLELPEPEYQLSEKSKGVNLHAEHTGRMMGAIESILLKKMPKTVLVQGDTNTVLAASLATVKIPGISLGHVEAGLRSYDRNMPEEINRIVSDHAAHYLFAPTPDAAKTLRGEGIPRGRIFMTGNSIVDAVLTNLKIAEKRSDVSRWLPKNGRPYFLMTLHRQENVDDRKRFAMIFRGIQKVAARFQTTVLFPIHPRTAGRLRQFQLRVPDCIRVIPPVGFLEFLNLENKAQLLLSDSGGVQEEGCILKVPCVTLRTTTERPETVSVGANIVAGFDPDAILMAAKRMMGRPKNWKNPFGDGRAADRLLKVLGREG